MSIYVLVILSLMTLLSGWAGIVFLIDYKYHDKGDFLISWGVFILSVIAIVFQSMSL